MIKHFNCYDEPDPNPVDETQDGDPPEDPTIPDKGRK